MTWLTWIYAIAALILALYGLNMVILLGIALRAWSRHPTPPTPPDEWPTVLVQLPIYNERYVVKRFIDAIVALDYPRDKLHIQVLDDSTDETSAIAQARVAHHQAQGVSISYHHRTNRQGYKAGALAAGLANDTSEFVAIFDADFLPTPDFLRSTVAVLAADPTLGMIQMRWEHLNAEQNTLTQVISLGLDCFFVVDQTARSAAGLLFNFNGSGGVWRRAAIDDAGGWNGETLTEDLDLSYRAQVRGWKFAYLPRQAAPAEIPVSILALKNQQFRWAKGSFQVLRRLFPTIITAPLSWWQKLQALIHLSSYGCHPLLVVVLLSTLPVVLLYGYTPLPLAVLGLGGLVGVVPLIGGIFSQYVLGRTLWRRLPYIPLMMLMGIGLAVSSTYALWEALMRNESEFVRTPKPPEHNLFHHAYALVPDAKVWGEFALALYALVLTILAVERAPGFAPFIMLYVLGFGAMALLSFWQSRNIPPSRGMQQPTKDEHNPSLEKGTSDV